MKIYIQRYFKSINNKIIDLIEIQGERQQKRNKGRGGERDLWVTPKMPGMTWAGPDHILRQKFNSYECQEPEYLGLQIYRVYQISA